MAGPDLRAPDLRAPPDLSPPPDLSGRPGPDLLPPSDLRTGTGAIGDPCTADGQCKAGAAPSCWKNTVRDQAGAPPTPGGYCTSTCTADGDCGPGARCAMVRGARACLAGCANDHTCRKPGYACAYYDVTGVCYPDTIYDCDPTTGTGTCTEAATGKPGGCLRGAYENKGTCTATCTIGTGTCPALSGTARQCVYQVAGFTDMFSGLLCLAKPASPVMPGGACAYVNDCTEGYQCDGIDKKCHQLCTKGVAMPCSIVMMSCADAFGTAIGGPGLCR